MKHRLIAILTTLVLASCGGGLFSSDCSDEIDSAIRTYGQPESIDKFDDGDYHSHSYDWFRKGIILTFTWGGPVMPWTRPHTSAFATPSKSSRFEPTPRSCWLS